MSVVRAEVRTLLDKGAVRVVSQEEALATPGHYSQVFAVPKPGGKWRVVINMKPLNEFVLKVFPHGDCQRRSVPSQTWGLWCGN